MRLQKIEMYSYQKKIFKILVHGKSNIGIMPYNTPKI